MPGNQRHGPKMDPAGNRVRNRNKNRNMADRSKSVEPKNQKTLEMNKAGGRSKSVEKKENQNGPKIMQPKNQTKAFAANGKEFPSRSPSPKFPGVTQNWTIFSDEELRRVKGKIFSCA